MIGIIVLAIAVIVLDLDGLRWGVDSRDVRREPTPQPGDATASAGNDGPPPCKGRDRAGSRPSLPRRKINVSRQTSIRRRDCAAPRRPRGAPTARSATRAASRRRPHRTRSAAGRRSAGAPGRCPRGHRSGGRPVVAARSAPAVSMRAGRSQNHAQLANIASRQRCASMTSASSATSSRSFQPSRSWANADGVCTPRTTSTHASRSNHGSGRPGRPRTR